MTTERERISAMNLEEVSQRVRLYRETHAEIGGLCAALHDRFGMTWREVGKMVGIYQTTAIKWADEWGVEPSERSPHRRVSAR
jgi:hypothetical protein